MVHDWQPENSSLPGWKLDFQHVQHARPGGQLPDLRNMRWQGRVGPIRPRDTVRYVHGGIFEPPTADDDSVRHELVRPVYTSTQGVRDG